MKTLRNHSWIAVLALALSTPADALPPASHTRLVQGAAKVLEGIRASLKQKQDQPRPPTAGEKFGDELKEFAERARKLSPEKGAAGWLKLYERFMKTRSSILRVGDYGSVSFSRLYSALPPPKAWRELKRRIRTRKADGALEEAERSLLSMMIAILDGDRKLLETASSDLRKLQNEHGDDSLTGIQHQIPYLLQTLEGSEGKRKSTLENFRKELEKLEKNPDAETYVQVPADLHRDGLDPATRDLKVLLTSKANAQFPERGETRTLARKLAHRLAKRLKKAPWSLAADVDGLELFQALDRHHPLPERPGEDADAEARQKHTQEVTNRLAAWRFALVSGLVAGEEAVVETVTGYLREHETGMGSAYSSYLSERGVLPQEGLDRLAAAGKQAELLTLLEGLLEARPALTYWKDYTDLGMTLGEEERVLARLRATLEKKDLSRPVSRSISGFLRKVLLATGRLEEAEPLIVKELTGDDDQHYLDSTVSQLATRWMTIGHLTDRHEWEQAGREALERCWKATEVNQPQSAMNMAIGLAKLLDDIDLPAEAEEVLAQGITTALRSRGGTSVGISQGSPAFEGLSALARLYHLRGRHADALYLLEHSPDWGREDLKDTLGRYRDKTKVPLATIAGTALAEAGRTEEARRVLEATLLVYPGNDAAYRAYVKLLGQDALPYLDFLRSRDAFQERPLIWKAKVLLDMKEPDRAEEAIRAAIAIDPSDGEQGHGDRMRAYAVLADVLAAKNQPEKARMYRGAVKAIRIAERADLFYGAGLVQASLDQYEEALAVFSGAYCIRSRLALRYSEIGSARRARKHFRKAFELMPASFGYMESHCFGCEGVFNGPLAQTIAEEVFTEAAKKKEDVPPQVPYLLGYLRQTQKRYTEARDAYVRATRDSADYFNAWTKLSGLKSFIGVDQKLLGRASRNLVRLDPLGRHNSHGQIGGVGLKELWTIADAARKLSREEPESLLPLKASRDRAELIASIQGAKPESERDVFGVSGDHSLFRVPDPGAVLGRHGTLQQLGSVLDQLKNQTLGY